MLGTVWIDDDNRVTRGADSLGRGDSDPEPLMDNCRQIMAGESDDGPVIFDLDELSAEVIARKWNMAASG